jgi:hypothetical protein
MSVPSAYLVGQDKELLLLGRYVRLQLTLSLSLIELLTEESSLEFHHQRVYLSTRTHSVTKQYCLLHEIAVRKSNVGRRARRKTAL